MYMIEIETREVARRLNSALGATLVSTLAGGESTEVSVSWAQHDGADPSPEEARRMHFAYEIWQEVSHAEGEQIARAWFTGANPWLDDETPVMAIREGHYEAVNIASETLTNDTFSG